MTTTALTRTHTCEHIKYWTSTPQPERVTAVTQNTAERRARYNTRKNEAPPFPFPGRHCGCRVWVAGRGGGGGCLQWRGCRILYILASLLATLISIRD